jgi:hypothetical protein
MIIPHSLDRGRAGNANTNQAMTKGGDVDQSGRRQFERGQRGERE